MNVQDFSKRWALHYINPDFMKIPMKSDSIKIYLQLINVQSNTIYKLYNSKNQLIWCSHYKNSNNEFIKGATVESYYYYGLNNSGAMVRNSVPSGYLIKKMPYIPSKNVEKYKVGPADSAKVRYGMALPVGTYYLKIGQSGQPVLQDTYQFSITDQYKSKKEWDDGEGTPYSHHYGAYEAAIKIIDVINMTESASYDSDDYIYITYTVDYQIVNGSEVYSYTSETTEERGEQYSWWGPLYWLPSNLTAESDQSNKKVLQTKNKFSFYHHLQNGQSVLLGEMHSWRDSPEKEPYNYVSGNQRQFLENYQYPSRYIMRTKDLYETEKSYTGEWFNVTDIYPDQDVLWYLRSFFSNSYRGYDIDYGAGETNIQIKNASFTWTLKKYYETTSSDKWINFRGYLYTDPTKRLVYTYQKISPTPYIHEGYNAEIWEIPPGAVVETPRHYYIDGEEFDYDVKMSYSGSLVGYSKRTSHASWGYPDGEWANYITECENLKPSVCAANGWCSMNYKFINARRAYTLPLYDMTFNAYGERWETYTHSGVRVLELSNTQTLKENYSTFWEQHDFIEILQKVLSGNVYGYYIPSDMVINPSDEDIDFGEFSELVHNFLNWNSYMRIYHRQIGKIYVVDVSDIPEYNPGI